MDFGINSLDKRTPFCLTNDEGRKRVCQNFRIIEINNEKSFIILEKDIESFMFRFPNEIYNIKTVI